MFVLSAFSITGNSLILLAVLVIMVFAVAYALFNRRGSGIALTPWDGSQGAPGAKGKAEVSGKDQGEGSSLNQHGTDSKDSERGTPEKREAQRRG